MTQKQVAIIGAGASGLICARECLREGLTVQIFEKARTAGGTWILDQVPLHLQKADIYQNGYEELTSTVHSSMYDNLRTNIPRHLMGVTDYPFDTHFPESFDSRLFPARKEVLNYIKSFKRAYDLERYVSYESEVTEVEPVGEGQDLKWKVMMKSDDKIQESEFDAVAVCNGHYSVPALPKIKDIEKFGKPCLHSHLYRNPEPYKDKTVVIFGNGPSGVDISQEIGTIAEKVYLCARRWKPHFLLNTPTGLRKNIIYHQSISQCLSEGAFRLEDGTVLQNIDAMVLCTGYGYDFPFLQKQDLVSTTNHHVYPVYKHFLHPKYPSLAFIGLPWKTVPFIMSESQSKYFARILAEKCELPSFRVMMHDIDARYKQLEEENKDTRYYHLLGVDQFAYMDELAALGGDSSRMPPWRKASYVDGIGALKKERPLDYRDVPFRQDLLEEAYLEFASLREKTNLV